MGLFSRDVPTDFKKQPTSVAFNKPRGLTASAVRINLKNKTEVETLKRRMESAKKWQKDAYDCVELIGELDFAANMIANTVSKVRLFPGYVTAEDTAPSNIFDMPEDKVSDELKKAALETLRFLNTGDGGMSGVLRDAALNLFIAGECYLVAEPAPEGSLFATETWQVRSIEEIVFKDGPNGTQRVFLRGSIADREEDLIPLGTTGGPNGMFVYRIWRNSPRFSKDATSSLKPQLENCDMLLLYNRAKVGIVKSHLPAGLLFMPDGMAASADADGEVENPADLEDGVMAEVEDRVDPLEEEIMDAFISPIQDPGSAGSVAPLIIRGPGELGALIRPINFTRPFDGQITADSQRLLERILTGIDLPKEIVAGLADLKFANALAVKDELYKSHIEPLILAIVDAFTVLLMRPVLHNLGFSDEEVQRVVVWYDPSTITSKPDKATSATTGLTEGAISLEAWRRAHDFSESDAPSGLELIQRKVLARGMLSEPITEAALKELDPELFRQIREASAEQSDPATRDAVQQAVGGETPAQQLTGPETAQPTEEPPIPLIEP